jgi:hypothetical protein
MKPADIDELIEKAEEAFAQRQVLEEKIRVAQSKRMNSPMESLGDRKDK